MRVPLSWLHEHVRPTQELRELIALLDLTGTAVEGVAHFGVQTPETIRVGRVLTAEQHPDADRLKVLSVDLGDGEPSQIVCGAPNVAAGQTVAVATPGTVMPDGTKLKAAKLRGVVSHGMVLSERELELSQSHDGIMVLPEGPAAGTAFGELVEVSTEVLEFDITPNRADCLGVYGVAREVGAVAGAPVGPPPWETRGTSVPEGEAPGISITVEVPDLCPRFTARLFEDVTVAESPAWLKARLSAAGQRPINNVVDITNYVMLLVGQPLHAFDADRIAGGSLVVRRARDGEPMTTLDDVERTLDGEMVLIADADGPTSIAGVMGGQRSEVQDDTTRVLLEVATWDGPNINRTMARLGLRSEAGARFEKRLPPEATIWAQDVATTLLVELCGARVAGGTVDVGGATAVPAQAPVLRLRDARTASLLGVEVPRAAARRALEALGFGAQDAEDGLDVSVPPWRRADVTREADLIEEVGRLVALATLPATLPVNRTGEAARLTTTQRLRRRAADALAGRGLHEVVGWSFGAPDVADALLLADDDPRRRGVVLENPMSEDQSVLRTTLLASVLDAARHNAARGMAGAALFEEGTTYLPPSGATGSDGRPALPHEVHALAVLVPGDVFAAKGVLEALAASVRAGVTVVQDRSQPFLHPGRAAVVRAVPPHEGPDAEAVGEVVGWLGELHPTVAARWDLGQASAFEVDLDALLAFATPVPAYADLTSYPELRQDLSVVLDAGVPAAELLRVVRRAGGKLLAGAEVFDVYTGTGIPEGRRSLTVALRFRAQDRTLSDEDAAPVHAAIVEAVAQDLGGELRG